MKISDFILASQVVSLFLTVVSATILSFPIPDVACKDKQGIIPLLESRHLWLRGYDSVRWIALNYWMLGAAHEIFALIFVIVLRW